MVQLWRGSGSAVGTFPVSMGNRKASHCIITTYTHKPIRHLASYRATPLCALHYISIWSLVNEDFSRLLVTFAWITKAALFTKGIPKVLTGNDAKQLTPTLWTWQHKETLKGGRSNYCACSWCDAVLLPGATVHGANSLGTPASFYTQPPEAKKQSHIDLHFYKKALTLRVKV